MQPRPAKGFAPLTAAVLLVVGLLGCSLTTSLSGYSDHSETQTADGGAAAVADATTPSGGEGGSIITDSSVRYCLGPGAGHTFCNDFDVGAVDEGWNLVQRNGGAVSLDANRFASAPRALRVDVTASTASNVAVYRSIKKAVSSARATFDVQIDKIQTSTANVSLAAFYFQDDAFVVHVLVRDGQLSLTQGKGFGESSALALVATPPPGRWTRIELELSLLASARSASVVVDGVTLAARAPLLSTSATSIEELAIGASVAFQPTELYFDNVTLDLQ